MHAALKTYDGEVCAAWQTAKATREPVFVPAPIFVDDRGWAVLNLLQGILSPEGQINISHAYPGVIKAWHRHRLQTDFWFCVSGQLKVGMHREEDGQSWMGVVGERLPGVLIIPPQLWHGIRSLGPSTSTLLYYVTHAYNADSPDEERRPHDSVDGFEWGTAHR